MGRMNKATEEGSVVISPLTLKIDPQTWHKFKILSASKEITLNDYVVELIKREIETKDKAIEQLQKE